MLDLLLLFGQKTAPDFFWDLRSGTILSGATFTRASAGWYFNSSGVLTQASTNGVRFDYDPNALTPLGYLAEVQSTNGLLRSGDLGNASWTASGVTVTSNSVAAPDGTTSMAKLLESAANVAHKVSQAITLATATTAGFSFFVKASARSKFYISLQASSANYATAIFDTAGVGTTASQTSAGGTSGTLGETGIRNCGGGIYRIWMQAKVTGANPTVVLGLASLATGNTVNTTGDVTYSGDGASFGYGWGAQFDTAGVGVTSYIPTTTATVTRAADLLTLPSASLPGWSATKGGVLVAAYRMHTQRPSGGQVVADLFDSGAFNNSVLLFEIGSARARTISAGNVADVIGAATPANFTRRKTAMGWSVTRQQIAHDGGFDAGAAAQSLPTGLVNLRFGADDGTGSLNGTLESLAYYAGARSDAFVAQVSR